MNIIMPIIDMLFKAVTTFFIFNMIKLDRRVNKLENTLKEHNILIKNTLQDVVEITKSIISEQK